MKKSFFAALAAVLSVSMVSCDKDSSFLGVDETLISKPSTDTGKDDQKAPEGSEVKFENVAYSNESATKNFELYTVNQTVDVDVVTYLGSTVVRSENVNRSLDLNALFSVEDIYVASEEELSSVELKEAAHGATTVENLEKGSRVGKVVDKNLSKTDYSFVFDQNDVVLANTKFETLVYGDTILPHASIQSVEFKEFTSSRDEELSGADSLVNNVVLYFDVTVLENSNIQSRANTTDVYTVAVPYHRIYMMETTEEPEPAQDEYLKTILIGSTDKIVGNDRVITVTTQEEWSVSGKKDPVTETIKLPINWSNPSVQSIYTANTNYSTRSNGVKAGAENTRTEGNFTVVTKASSYSSTATNNDKNFNNVYNMSDSKVTYKKNNVTVDFAYGNWTVSEASSTVGNPTTEGNYNVSVYTNNVYYTYAINGGQKTGKGLANAKLYVEKKNNGGNTGGNTETPVEKTLPAAWGKIIGAGISAVPSDDESRNVAKKCLTIRTEKGAIAIPFDWNSNICSVNNILNGYFVEGNFDASYNSGFYTTSTNKGSYAAGKWAPAKASDLSDRIAYYNGSKCVRNVTFTTLLTWGWANGQSTKVTGYTFNVSNNDGTLTVELDGQVVLIVR